MDVQAVLKEYIRLDREITEKTKDVLQKRNLPYEQFGKVKRTLAGEKALRPGRGRARVDDDADDRVVHAVAAHRRDLRRRHRAAKAHEPTCSRSTCRSTRSWTRKSAAGSRTWKKGPPPGRSSTARFWIRSSGTAVWTSSLDAGAHSGDACVRGRRDPWRWPTTARTSRSTARATPASARALRRGSPASSRRAPSGRRSRPRARRGGRRRP